MSDEKVRENRLRRMAERQGLRLQKSRRRDPRALDYGAFFIVRGPASTQGGANWRARELLSPESGMTLDEVETFLTDAPRP